MKASSSYIRSHVTLLASDSIYPVRKKWVKKSGHFARASAANIEDVRLIKSCADLAVECAMRRESGVMGHDEDNNNILRVIEFPRIKGGKPFNIDTDV